MIDKIVFPSKDELDKLELPTGVKNRDKYVEWYLLRWEIDHHPWREYVSSNKVVVDALSPKNVIRNKLKDCPRTELDSVIKVNTELRSKHMRSVAIWKQVYTEDGKILPPEQMLEERSEEIIELYGRWHTDAEVHRIAVEQWGYRVTPFVVRRFALKNKEKIAMLRQKYEEDYSDMSIGVKRSRLERLSYLLSDRMQIYERHHKLEDSRELRAILDAARKEVEGDVLKLDISGKIDIEATLTMEFQGKVLNRMLINQIILSRVSARLGVSPVMLMNRLVNSYYSKFNGFRKNDELTAKPIYPSSIPYDFNEIESKYATIEMREVEEAKIVDISKEEKPKMDDIRQRLAASLAKKKQHTEDSRKRVHKTLTK